MSTVAIVAIVVGSVVAYALIGSIAFGLCRLSRRYDFFVEDVFAGVLWPLWLLTLPMPALGRFGLWVANLPDRRREKRKAAGIPKATAKERAK